MKRIAIRIRYDHRGTLRGTLAIVTLTILFLAALALKSTHATAPSAPTSVRANLVFRQYYLSKTMRNGAQALDACADGYHFASLWEIADPSALKYAPRLGQTATDSGAGPPTGIRGFSITIPARGWVRTGYLDSTGVTPGRANCDVWTSDSGTNDGTTVHLPSDWASGSQKVGVWIAESYACNSNIRVWCVQDENAFRVFLPVVLRH
jgi:hypothetical protein